MSMKMWRNLNPYIRWQDCKMVQLKWKTVGRFLKILKPELPYDSAIPPLGICPNELKSWYQRGISSSTFIATLLQIAKLSKQPKWPSTDEWRKLMWSIHMMECYSFSLFKKKEILQYMTTWTNLNGIMLREISQSQEDIYCIIPLI